MERVLRVFELVFLIFNDIFNEPFQSEFRPADKKALHGLSYQYENPTKVLHNLEWKIWI